MDVCTAATSPPPPGLVICFCTPSQGCIMHPIPSIYFPLPASSHHPFAYISTTKQLYLSPALTGWPSASTKRTLERETFNVAFLTPRFTCNQALALSRQLCSTMHFTQDSRSSEATTPCQEMTPRVKNTLHSRLARIVGRMRQLLATRPPFVPLTSQSAWSRAAAALTRRLAGAGAPRLFGSRHLCSLY